MSHGTLHKRIGIVFQAYNLFPRISELDNVTLAPRKVNGEARDESEGHAHQLLSLFGLEGFAATYPSSCRAASSSASPSFAR